MRPLLLALNTTAFITILPVVCLAEEPKKTPPVAVEIRRAESAPTKGFKEMAVRGRDNKIYVAERSDLTSSDITKAKLDEFNGECQIAFFFTGDGEQKLRKLLSEHSSKRLAIMVNGEVVSSPVINFELSPRPGVGIQLGGQFTREELEKIAKSINDR